LFIKTNFFLGSVFRPLFFEFPDEESLLGKDDAFLLGKLKYNMIYLLKHLSHTYKGSEIMVVPAMDPGVDHVDAYFPKSSNFYCYFQGTKYLGGQTYKISAPLGGNAPLFLREGSIVFVNQVDDVMRTSDLTNDFILKIVLKKTSGGELSAEGFLLGTPSYDDDSIIQNCLEKTCINKITISVSKTVQVDMAFLRLDIDLTANDKSTILDNVNFYELQIYGLDDGFQNSIFKYRPEQPISLVSSTNETIFVPLVN
jgi:alpha-glucosidase (family GH31 glycosyl hydrolase)